MQEIKSAVYIGPWFDTTPLLAFSDIKRFILIECQPKYNSSGMQHYEKYDNKTVYKREREYIVQLNNYYKNIGYFLVGESENYLKFKNNNHSIIEYYYNTLFNKNIPEYLIERIKKCNILIDIGFHPDKYILELLPEKFDLVVNSKTCYETYDYQDEINNLFNTKYTHDILRSRVDNIYIINEINYVEYEEKNYDENTKIEIIKGNNFDKMLRLVADLKNV